MHTPWLYNWVGEPWKAQAVIRRAMLGLFHDSAGGIPGNDDGGTMSAWYVFAAMGLFPSVPSTDVLVLSSPLFPKATLHLPGGDLVIMGDGAAPDAPYVQRLTLDGKSYDKSWLRFADVARGGTLRFELSKKPNVQWASDPAAAPPSRGPKETAACVGGLSSERAENALVSPKQRLPSTGVPVVPALTLALLAAAGLVGGWRRIGR